MVRRLLPLLLLFVSCTAAPPPQVAPSRLAASGVARRVVVMSFDGMGADALAQQTGLPAFERLAKEGASARVLNVNPTLTASTHVSILTGADPQRHGIVSNRMHVAGRPASEVAMGMSQDVEVETLVEAARRQGKRVGTLSFPTVDQRGERRSSDFGLGWSEPLVPARIVSLTRRDFHREWVPPTWTSRPTRRLTFSPVMRARIEWQVPQEVRLDVDVVAYDTTDDRVENYDSFYIEAGEQEIAPDRDGWFAVSRQTREGLAGSWSKVMSAQPELDVTIYWGAISRTDAWPAAFRAIVDEEAGFWPGAAEERLPIDVATFGEMASRLARFLSAAQTASIRRMPFDLLLTYHPEIDQSAHEYLATPSESAAMHAAFVIADRAVQEAAEELDPGDALIVTGDHGLTAAKRELRVNRFLADHGFIHWRAYASGSFAQIYRLSGNADDSGAVMKALSASPLIERVEKKTAAHNARNGEILAWGWPDVAMSESSEAPAVLDAKPHGQHGGWNAHRELHPPFFAIGAGVNPGPLGEIRQTQIARFIASLLGISPPAAAE